MTKREAANWVVRQKYLFDQGQSVVAQFMGIFNTGLLLVVASDKIKHVTGIQRTGAIVVPAVVIYLAGTWAIARLLDRLKFFELYYDEANKRSYHFVKMKEAYEKHED